MPDPMYRQIAEDLRRQIEAGELRPGAQLPTELELREKHDASRNTIRDAIKALVTRGLIETRPGQGTFVVEKIVPFVTTLSDPDIGGESDVYLAELTAKRRNPETSHPKVEIQQADARVAGELRLDKGSTVVSRHQLRYIDGTPWSLQTSFYPMKLVERGAVQLIQATDIKPGTVSYLRESLGIEQAGWRDTITVRAPDEVETGFFKLPDDGRIPVIESRRTAFDKKGTPVRVTVSVYPADRNQFAANFGDVPADAADPAASATGVADPPAAAPGESG